MDWMDPLPIFFLLVLTVTLLWKMGSFWNGNCQNFPPGPRPLQLIRSLYLLDLKRPYIFLSKLSKRCGPVFSIQIGALKMVVLTGYETVKEALVNQADAFAGRPFIPIFEETMKGYGVIFAHGENWRVMRRFVLTTLRGYGMGKRTIEDKIVEECDFLIKIIESYEGNPFENTAIMNGAVSNIIVSILLGKRFGYEDPTFIRLQNLITENVQLLASPSVQLYNMFPALGFLLGTRKTVLNNTNELQAFIQATFIEHLKDLDENDQRSFIDSFLVRQQEEKDKPNGYFHNENLKTVVGNLFGAGTDTSSTTLRWGLLLMMKYPEIQRLFSGLFKDLGHSQLQPLEDLANFRIRMDVKYGYKVQEEITQVIGSAQPQTEHRSKMPYTNAVIHEIQRFSNIVPISMPRATTVDVTFKGYSIPKGTFILPLLCSVLQDETQWEKPQEFYPEHFLDSEGKFVKRDAFMPFSAGRRICAGKNLAKMEIFLFFTILLQRFTFQPAPGLSKEDLDLTPMVGLTTPPVPYKCCALSRC